MADTTAEQPAEQSLGEKKLKLAGYSYVLGDAAMMAAGMARGKTFVQAARSGGVWAAGGMAAGYFGNPGTEKQLALLANKLEHHLKKTGYGIPDDVRAQNTLLKKETFWQKIEDFVYEHPSEMLNAAYAVGSGFLIKDGLKQIRENQAHWWPGKGNTATDLWIGAIVGTGALIGLFAKEDPQAREKAKDGTLLDKAVAFVSEKPLRTTSAIYFANNGFLAKQAWQDWQGSKGAGPFVEQKAKPHYFSTMQLATYLFANTMLALSPRNQIAPHLPAEGVAQLEDASARIIAAQAPQVQQALLADVSQYLSAQKGIQQKPEEIATALATRITEITGERMAQAAGNVSWAEREKARAASAAELEQAGATR
ncbi:MAG: hypothetical protein DI582_09735 [Azospirillum brasilense]|nr:MAG: hypothetical protein DI582_09735 [Azospirillum brasilense]